MERFQSGPNSYVERRYTGGWGGGYGNQGGRGGGNPCCAIVFGVLFVCASVPLLFMLETRAVEVYNGLEESAGIVRDTPWDDWSERYSGRLLHLFGTAVPSDPDLQDDFFDVRVKNAVKLRRRVEMYQWKEHRRTVRRGNVEDTEYNYDRVWDDTPINSNNFHVQGEGYDNPSPSSWTVRSASTATRNVYLGNPKVAPGSAVAGKYSLGNGLIDLMSNWHGVRVPKSAAKRGRWSLAGNTLYSGDRYSPRIGDVRVTFDQIPSDRVSIVAMLDEATHTTLVPYITKYNREVLLLESGSREVDAQTMIEHAMAANTMWTWAGRAGLFLMMWIGISMVTSIIDTLVGWIPILGSIARFITGVVSFLSALALFSVTFALAWMWARPVLSLSALAVAAGIVYMADNGSKRKAGAQHGYEPVKTEMPVKGGFSHDAPLKNEAGTR